MSLTLFSRPKEVFEHAQAIAPTADTGWATYSAGSRLFLPAQTNYCTNPSFEVDTNEDGLADGWGWDYSIIQVDKTLSRVAALGTGTYAQRAQVVATAGAIGVWRLTNYASRVAAAFSPGDSVTVSFLAKGSVSGCSAAVYIYDGNAYIVDTQLFTLTETAQRFSATGVIGAGGSEASVFIGTDTLSEGDTFDITIDDVLIEKSSVLTPYFDGTYPNCAWTAGAHSSTSTRTASSLIDPAGAYVVDAAGTIFLRFVPLWAGNNGVLHEILSIRNAGDTADAVRIYKDTDNKVKLYLAGAGTKTIDSAAQSFAANSSHVLVARWKNGDEAGPVLDLNLDGVDVAQVVNDQTITVGKIVIGAGATNVGASYLGPVGFAPSYKSGTWTTAIQASSGAAYGSLPRLWRQFMSAGDLLIPLYGNSTAFLKRAGTGSQA